MSTWPTEISTTRKTTSTGFRTSPLNSKNRSRTVPPPPVFTSPRLGALSSSSPRIKPESQGNMLEEALGEEEEKVQRKSFLPLYSAASEGRTQGPLSFFTRSLVVGRKGRFSARLKGLLGGLALLVLLGVYYRGGVDELGETVGSRAPQAEMKSEEKTRLDDGRTSQLLEPTEEVEEKIYTLQQPKAIENPLDMKVRPPPHGSSTPAPILPDEQFLAYTPHSGYHNQRLALENALSLAFMLNRTLLLPPVWLGHAIPYIAFDKLQRRLQMASKVGLERCKSLGIRGGDQDALPRECEGYFDSTLVHWEFLVDLTRVREKVRLRDRWDQSRAWLKKDLALHEERKGNGEGEKERKGDTFYLKDETMYQYRFYDSLNDLEPLAKFENRVELGRLRDDSEGYRLLHLGSLFGTSRIRTTTEENFEARSIFREAMVFHNPILDEAASSIRDRLGGASNYYSLHLRVGDGIFQANAESNMEAIWKELCAGKMKLEAEVCEEASSTGARLLGRRRLDDEKVMSEEPVVWIPDSVDSAKVEGNTSTTLSLHVKRANSRPQRPGAYHHAPLPALPLVHTREESSLHASLSCRAPLHTAPHLLAFNTPLFIATDSALPLLSPPLARFFNAFPCTFLLSDFSHISPTNNQTLPELTKLERLRNEEDGVPLGRFLFPMLDAMISAMGRDLVGTGMSTYSRFAGDVLYQVYHGWDIIERGVKASPVASIFTTGSSSSNSTGKMAAALARPPSIWLQSSPCLCRHLSTPTTISSRSRSTVAGTSNASPAIKKSKGSRIGTKRIGLLAGSAWNGVKSAADGWRVEERKFHTSRTVAAKDPYSTLGVAKGATGSEIKKSYHQLAKKFHPDVNKDKSAKEKFVEIQDAYDTLSDEKKRADFDRFGAASQQQGFDSDAYARATSSFGGGFGDFSFGGGGGQQQGSDIFESLFGAFGRGGQARPGQANFVGEDIEAVISIPFVEAAKGTKRSVEITPVVDCHTCHGSGLKEGMKKATCKACGGSGTKTFTIQSGFQMASTCNACQGSGSTTPPGANCGSCAGVGKVRERKFEEVDVPAGVDQGMRIRINGKGDVPIQGKGRTGDLYIRINVQPSKTFRRQGSDLFEDVSIPFYTAILGGAARVATLDEDVQIKVLRGTQPGEEMVLKNRGVKKLNKAENGDLFVRFNVSIPRDLTAEQRRILQQFVSETEVPGSAAYAPSPSRPTPEVDYSQGPSGATSANKWWQTLDPDTGKAPADPSATATPPPAAKSEPSPSVATPPPSPSTSAAPKAEKPAPAASTPPTPPPSPKPTAKASPPSAKAESATSPKKAAEKQEEEHHSVMGDLLKGVKGWVHKK